MEIFDWIVMETPQFSSQREERDKSSTLKSPQYNKERQGQKMLILEGKWGHVES